ncbi:MAG: spondin domain-containing protein [Vicinamibacteria bacterium]
MTRTEFAHRAALRGLAVAALLIAPMTSSSVKAHDDDGDAQGPSVYYVTLANTTLGHGFSFPVAATHAPGVHMYQLGQNASAAAAQIAQNGNPVPMFNLMRSTAGVTAVYGHAFPMASGSAGTRPWGTGFPAFDSTSTIPGLYPTAAPHTLNSSISFTITGARGDRFSVLGMMMCTNDGLAGLDSVKLPNGVGDVRAYNVHAYDAGVELNTERAGDIVDPCAAMAPAGSIPAGNPLLTPDGNVNSPPSGSATSIQTSNPVAPYSEPTIAGVGDVPANFAWDADKPVGRVTITRIK